ncbi:alpha/beta hydrolase [Sphingobacteriales bacterium UPWRP_1]|nr:hypothetical protein B6N25_00875 [Sphingobacteriales bacterium TSM_CSS]PSJ72328.1 alpha/beta hydrolase [Sphingobacteriales bacterium UPWRP_1]
MNNAVILLHGALGNAQQMQPIADLLKSQYQVFTLNFAGHGGTPFAGEQFTITGFAEEVLAYMEANSLEKAHIFGYSMGGYVGLYLARQFPDKVTKVATFATKFLWNTNSAAKEAGRLNPDKILEKVPEFARKLQEQHGEQWKQVLERTAAMMLNLGVQPDLPLEETVHITIPVLLGLGDRDTMVSLEETGIVYRMLPEGQLLVMPNTPHPFEKVNMQRLATELSIFFGQ